MPHRDRIDNVPDRPELQWEFGNNSADAARMLAPIPLRSSEAPSIPDLSPGAARLCPVDRITSSGAGSPCLGDVETYEQRQPVIFLGLDR